MKCRAVSNIVRNKPTSHQVKALLARVIDRYNREHKTHYTYGQFVEALENGKIKL